jgi:hypothetical protein
LVTPPDEVPGSVLPPQTMTATRSSDLGRYARLVNTASAAAPPCFGGQPKLVPQQLAHGDDRFLTDRHGFHTARDSGGEADIADRSGDKRIGRDPAEMAGIQRCGHGGSPFGSTATTFADSASQDAIPPMSPGQPTATNTVSTSGHCSSSSRATVPWPATLWKPS